MTDNIKILHLDFGMEWRGGQRQSLTLHRNLLKHNFSSYYVCLEGSRVYEQAHEIGINHVLAIPFRKPHLTRLLKEWGPAILHFHESKSLKYAPFFRQFKTVATRRVSYPISFLGRMFKYKAVDHHVGVSQEIADYLSGYFRNVTTIHSCVDKERFAKAPVKIFKNDKINVLFVGAFSPQKGLEILMEASKKIIRSFPNVHFHLVGDGELMPAIRKMQDHNEGFYTFYGHRKNVEDFYLNADLVIVPSVGGEGSSGTIKEGMMAGKPVIASDLACNFELLPEELQPFCFKNKSVPDLEEKIEAAIKELKNFDREKLTNTALEFSCEKMTEKYISLYQSLAGAL